MLGGRLLLKKICKAIFTWGLALVIAVACANFLSFFYRSGAGSILRDNAFSSSIRTPNSRLVRASEGYGINYADENGYLNTTELPLRENYILLMGSSHAEGLQVMQKDNMTSVLNRMFDDETRTVYNLGSAGYTLPLIVKGFQAALDEFPNSSAIFIEVSRVSFSRTEWEDAMNQTHFSEDSTGQALVKSQSTIRKIRNAVLESVPIISLLRAQFESMSYGFEGAFGIDPAWFNQTSVSVHLESDGEEQTDETQIESTAEPSAVQKETYYDLLNKAFAMLRSEYDKPIILLYHPVLWIQSDGSMVMRKEEGTYEACQSACANNDITFVDTGDAFLAAYEADQTVPYGFANTTIGNGHLNAQGHKIVAEEFYRALRELTGKGKE